MSEFLKKIARYILREEIQALNEVAGFTEQKVSQKVAVIVSKLDPMELVLKKYNGSFLDEYERADERLNEQGRIQMEQFGYQFYNDECFELLMNWVANRQATMTFKKARNTEDLLFGQATLLVVEVIKKEVKRLHSLYLERTRPEEGFDRTKTVE